MNGLKVIFGLMDEAEARAARNGHRLGGWAAEGHESALAACVDCGASCAVLAASGEVRGLDKACVKKADGKVA